MAVPAGWIDLGAVGYTDKGNYNPTTSYNKLNVVKYKGSSWVCNLDNTIGKEPTEGIYWHTMMEGVAVATTEKTGTVMPDGETILVDKDGKISVPTATDSASGLMSAADKAKLDGVDLATTSTAGLVKPDGTTIKIADDGTISAEEALAKKGDALAYDSKTGELTLKSGDTGLSTVTIKSGSGEISLVITFSEEFKGLEYTIAGGSESYTDTVPSSLIATHTVEALETIYTITAMYEGTEYTTTVRTGDYYGHYFGSLTAWKAYIEATVTDAISGPVVGADVTAKSNTKSYHATTDSTGKATIQIGKAGTYTVSALNTGGETSDSTSVTVSTEGETYATVLTFLKIVTWADGTDEEVAAMVAAADKGAIKLSDYWAVGDERKVKLSAMAATGVGETQAVQEVTMVLMNVGGVTLQNGKECNFVVGQKNSLATYGYMNSSDTNSGSWGNCARRKWCNEVYFKALPEYFQNMLKMMETKTPLAEGAGAEVQTVEDMIALPASAQVWKDDATVVASRGDGYSFCAREDFNIGLEQWEWFKTPANRVKKQGDTGSACPWWERSPSSTPSLVGQCFCHVVTDGTASAGAATGLIGLAPFGCI